MNPALIEQVVNAVLYEGYILYPYRASSKKNRRERFTFGRVYPEAYNVAQKGAEPCLLQTECLIEAPGNGANLEVSLRFLHPMAREIGALEQSTHDLSQGVTPYLVVPELRVGGEMFQTWHEAIERRVDAPGLNLDPTGQTRHCLPFSFPDVRNFEPIRDGQRVVGVIVRRQAGITGTVEVAVQPVRSGLFKVTARVLNRTAFSETNSNSEALLLRTLASTHTVLGVRGGAFVSLMDPPAQFQPDAELCKNIGTWPVLVGDENQGERDAMLSSPIILYDYPKISPQSAGPLFDGTEIDEILTLRILTMTEDEKKEMRRVDEQARHLLERTESLSEDSLLKLHGTMRRTSPEERVEAKPLPAANAGSVSPQSSGETPGISECEELGHPASQTCSSKSPSMIEFDDFFGANTRLEGVSVGGVYLRPGARVRIRPKARADLLDIVLSGQTALVEAVEQDAERRIHLGLVLENDPGKDLGLLRQPGHRFFYGLDEVEPLGADEV